MLVHIHEKARSYFFIPVSLTGIHPFIIYQFEIKENLSSILVDTHGESWILQCYLMWCGSVQGKGMPNVSQHLRWDWCKATVLISELLRNKRDV